MRRLCRYSAERVGFLGPELAAAHFFVYRGKCNALSGQIKVDLLRSSRYFQISFVLSINWLIDWLIDWPIDWLIDWLIDLWIDWLSDRLIDWLNGNSTANYFAVLFLFGVFFLSGARVKFQGVDKWFSLKEGNAKSMPDRHMSEANLEAIDAAGLPLMYEGMDHFSM